MPPKPRHKPARVDYDSRRVPASKLVWRCPPSGLDFETTDDIELSTGIIGQRRAVEALELGLEIESSGYNIFVTGPIGTGRTTTVRKLLARVEDGRRAEDKCYVYNFQDPDRPRLLRLEAGQGRRFQKDMDECIAQLVQSIPQAFEGENYQRRRQDIVEEFKERGAARVREFEKKVAAAGFALVQPAPMQRPELAPIVEKQPVRVEALDGLVEEGRLTREQAAAIKAQHRQLTDEMVAVFKEIRGFELAAREALVQLDQSVIGPLVTERLAELRERYPQPCVAAHLDAVHQALLARIDTFRRHPAEGQEAPETGDAYLEFRVNVLVDQTGVTQPPVIFETNPSYKNLFGAIERVWDRGGQWRTDFTQVKAGSILRADGGFLVLNALDVLLEPAVWPALKRTLRNRRLEITTDPYSALFGGTALKPEPIDIDLKVIIIGDPMVYALLTAYDEDFRKVFRVRADFDWEMDLDADAVREYAQVIRALCEKERLRPFDRAGVQAVVEYGVRLAGRQNKVSTRFNIITDVLKEASYWAGKAGAKVVTAAHVREALEKRRDRVRLHEEKLQEMINQGTLFIDVDGSVVGQVNGLAVYETPEYAFGKPVRITAKTGVGSAGIINIEREAQLSGRTHDKGVYILTGFLRARYAQKQPLAFTASICFEQSYAGIDGDSASSTEVYAILSDLSGLPIRQDLAVTGSVNQRGQIQPIGGVNWKIEGFFETCRQRGLTGRQGVIVPRANLPDLMLRPEVTAAVEQGRFHIYAVATIDEGIELLTGTPAAEVDRRVRRRLAELARLARRSDSGKKS
uniref:endopeptidase La n=1 Tax=candidate division WOR-3 bacterium TaxID=2052148 RepID=A0A7C4CAG1_UNCW3